MSAHIVLLFEPDRPSTRIESSIASELEKAGYEVVEAHNLNVAAALVFIDRRIEAVVIDAASEQVFPQLARGASAIRPAIPLFSAASAEMRATADKQAGHDWAIVISALYELFRQRVA
jgi:DNA-binding response OmpR family regulator